jgi:hypothetical protein
MIKRATPKSLLPFWPVCVVKNKPCWLTEIPRIHRLKAGGALLLDDVSWRSRHGLISNAKRGLFFDGMSYPFFAPWDKYDPITIREAALHDDHYCLYDWCFDWPMRQKDVDIDLLDGLKIGCPRRAHTIYIIVKLAGYSVWAHPSYSKMIEQWLSVVDYPEQLDAWIQGVIANDNRA